MFLAFQKTKRNYQSRRYAATFANFFDQHLKEGLGKRIKYKWSVDGTDKWYLGTILGVVAGTSGWSGAAEGSE